MKTRTYLFAALLALLTLPAFAQLQPGGYQACASAELVTAPADTAENALYSCTIPANAMGPKGSIRVGYIGSNNNSAGTKTWRVRFSGIGGNVFQIAQITTVVATVQQLSITNRNATNSQIGGTGSTSISFGAVAAPATATVDTTAATTLVLSCQKSVGADTCGMERILVEVLPAR